jgi:hypothetical protein
VAWVASAEQVGLGASGGQAAQAVSEA